MKKTMIAVLGLLTIPLGVQAAETVTLKPITIKGGSIATGCAWYVRTDRVIWDNVENGIRLGDTSARTKVVKKDFADGRATLTAEKPKILLEFKPDVSQPEKKRKYGVVTGTIDGKPIVPVKAYEMCQRW